MRTEISDLIDLTIQGLNKDPHAVLGMHSSDRGVIVRVFNPHSRSVVVKDLHSDRSYPMERIDDRGFFQLTVEESDLFPYQLVHTTTEGAIYTAYDPYSFLPTLSDYDTFLFNQGNHHYIYEKLGCHLREVDGVKGASRFGHLGQAGQCCGKLQSMGRTDPPDAHAGKLGVWELFIPGLLRETSINMR